MNSNVARKAELPSEDCRCISAILANTNGYRDTMTPQKTTPALTTQHRTVHRHWYTTHSRSAWYSVQPKILLHLVL